jgi:hypothetical protein
MERLTSSDEQVGPLAAYLPRHLAESEAQTHFPDRNVKVASGGPTKPGEGLERAQIQAGQGLQSFQSADGSAAELPSRNGGGSHQLESMGAKGEESEKRLGDGGEPRERPTVVRIKRRRTESPLDALSESELGPIHCRSDPGSGQSEAPDTFTSCFGFCTVP